MAREQNRQREETLERVSALLEQGDADKAALESAKMLLEIYSVFLEQICRDVKSPDFSVDLIIRCIARKAEEGLRAIVTLVEAGQPYSAMPLLRPMCEEYLLTEFLLSLNEAEANEVLKEKSKLDILQGIWAQGSFFPKAAEIFHFDDFVEDASLPERLKMLSSEIDSQKSKLRALGQRLNWGKRPFPTAKQMAEKTDNLPIYEFFYHAASSAAHASLHHLGRMVWGDSRSGVYSITNQNFGQYYGRFALIYGCWLSCATMSIIRQRFHDDWPSELEDSFSILFAFCVKRSIIQKAPGIVTDYELRIAAPRTDTGHRER
jgi:Family of unknown function (DUF5677)